MKDRIRLLFVPFILVLAGLIIGYTFLHWLLFIELELFQFERIVTNFGIPIVLTGLSAWLILRPRFKLLKLESKKANWQDFFSILIWIFLTIPLVISQEYIVTASGKLTELNSINDINRLEPTKYYSLKKRYIDKKLLRTHSSFDVSGKYNANFNMHIYVALPIFEKASDINNLEPIAWLGTEYRKTIDNKLGQSEKEREYQKFSNESKKDFEEKNVSDFVYLDRLGPSAKKEGFIAAIKTNPFYKPNEVILEAVNEPFEARNGKKLEWIIGSSLIGSVLWFLVILIPRVDQRYLKEITVRRSGEEASEYLREFIFYLSPKKDYIVTPFLIYANIGFYVLMAISGLGFFSFKGLDLLHWGANFGPLTTGGEWWRLFTSVFLHGGLIHLLANMYGLLFVGILVEKKLGSMNFLLLYFLSGLIAGIASLNFNLFEVSVGASGAIFGIYGFLIVETIRENPTNKIAILINFITYLLIVFLVGTYLNFDNAAHIGGTVAGVLVGISYRKLRLKIVYSIGFAIALISFLISPNYQATYFNTYQDFVSNDLRIDRILESRLDDKAFFDSLTSIKNLPQETINDFRSIDYLPKKLSQDTSVLVNYLTFRSKKIDYFLEGVSKESFIYFDSIGLIDFKISNLPKIEYDLDFNSKPSDEKIDQGDFEHLDLVRQNYDSSWLEVNSDEFAYYRIGQKDSLGDWHGRVADYFKNGTIQMKGNYQRGLQDGIFIYYSSDSTYSSAGRYLADNRIGKWETYHKNGKLYVETRHVNGYSYIENLWDSTGRQLVVKGNGDETYKYPNGMVSYSRNIVDGLNDGFVESYYENGDLRFKEYYENGDLIKGVSFIENTENSYDWSVNSSYPSGGFESFYSYIDRENKLKSDSTEAFVVMRFDVHSTGELQNIRFLKRSNEKHNQHAKELLVNGPKWIPARSHGLVDISSFAEVRIEF